MVVIVLEIHFSHGIYGGHANGAAAEPTPQQRRSLTALQLSELNHLVRTERTASDIAKQMGLSPQTVIKYRKRVETTGNVYLDRSKLGQNAVKLRPNFKEALFEFLADKPDSYLEEMRLFLAENHKLDVHGSTISRHLTKIDWANKKHIPSYSDPLLRRAYLQEISKHTAEQVVFLDESGTDKGEGPRRTGWFPKTLQPSVAKLFEREHRLYVLLALHVDGLLDHFMFRGSPMKKDDFISWVLDCVLQKMNPYPGPRSVLVTDNAGWHHDETLTKACEEAGVRILYLPPYSPDFNPIEPFIRLVKAKMRPNNPRPQVLNCDEEFIELLERTLDQVGNEAGNVRGLYHTAKVPRR